MIILSFKMGKVHPFRFHILPFNNYNWNAVLIVNSILGYKDAEIRNNNKLNMLNISNCDLFVNLACYSKKAIVYTVKQVERNTFISNSLGFLMMNSSSDYTKGSD